MKFKTKSIGKYEVVVNGEVVGTVWKTPRHGYTYWKYDGCERFELCTTRNEAAAKLIQKGAV